MKSFISIFIVGLTFIGFLLHPVESQTFFPPQPNTTCFNSETTGLLGVINKFMDLIPMEDMATALLIALVSDPEFTAFMYYLQESTFTHLLYEIGEIPEYVNLVNYFCDELYYNIPFHLNFVGSLFDIFPVKPNGKLDGNEPQMRLEGGVIGLIEEFNALLPIDELGVLYEELIETDEYFQKAGEKLQTPELKLIFDKMQGKLPFLYMVKAFREIYNVPIDCLFYELAISAGWRFYPWLDYSSCIV